MIPHGGGGTALAVAYLLVLAGWAPSVLTPRLAVCRSLGRISAILGTVVGAIALPIVSRGATRWAVVEGAGAGFFFAFTQFGALMWSALWNRGRTASLVERRSTPLLRTNVGTRAKTAVIVAALMTGLIVFVLVELGGATPADLRIDRAASATFAAVLSAMMATVAVAAATISSLREQAAERSSNARCRYRETIASIGFDAGPGFYGVAALLWNGAAVFPVLLCGASAVPLTLRWRHRDVPS